MLGKTGRVEKGTYCLETGRVEKGHVIWSSHIVGEYFPLVTASVFLPILVDRAVWGIPVECWRSLWSRHQESKRASQNWDCQGGQTGRDRKSVLDWWLSCPSGTLAGGAYLFIEEETEFVLGRLLSRGVTSRKKQNWDSNSGLPDSSLCPPQHMPCCSAF